MVVPTAVVAAVFFVLAAYTRQWPWAVPGAAAAVLALLMLNFFRDFERRPVAEPGPRAVLSPADGKVVVLKKAVEKFYMKKPMLHVAIFMNPLNNHVQRAPFDGKVVKKAYHAGEFLAAYDDKADLVNEQAHLVLELDKKKGMKAKHRVVLKQIAGLLCRRVKADAKPGQRVVRGERFGRILLGSRVDLFLPVGFKPSVKKGDQVRAGLTVLGELP
ncbi:MAG TPA: phosphatidylserine decarboxylase [bacterium]|nr:phosphatidylserine decarboxylase [bacterium]